MTQAELNSLLYDLEILLQSVKSKQNNIEESQRICYEYMSIWLQLTLKLLKPLSDERSKASKFFFENFFSLKQNGKDSISQLKANIGSLLFNSENNPLNFYTEKYESRANYLFLIGLMTSVMGGIATGSFAYLLPTTTIIACALASAAIFVIFTTAGIHQLQKSKKINDAFNELKIFEFNKFKEHNTYNLFQNFQYLNTQTLVKEPNSP